MCVSLVCFHGAGRRDGVGKPDINQITLLSYCNIYVVNFVIYFFANANSNARS